MRNRDGIVGLYEDVSPSLSLIAKEGDMQCTKYGRTTRETGNVDEAPPRYSYRAHRARSKKVGPYSQPVLHIACSC
jgi:hypothetical protein